MPVTAIKFFGFILKKSDDALLNKYLIFDDFITGIILFLYLQLEHTIATAPFLIASFINFSPLNLCPFKAKKQILFEHNYYLMLNLL